MRLPRAAVEKLALKEGADVEITVEDGALVIRSGQPRYLLSDLVRAAKGLAAPAALDDGAIGSEQL